MATRNQPARYWLATLADRGEWEPTPDLINDTITYVKGQKEHGEGGYVHYQFVVYCKNKLRLNALKRFFPNYIHLEPTKSDAARAYCGKEDTRIEGTQFEFGRLPLNRNDSTDWVRVRDAAQSGNLDDDVIPADVYVRHYSSLTRIAKDHVKPQPRLGISVLVYWGVTGSGKTFRAYQEAAEHEGGLYFKNHRTKWWDGYKGELNVLMDEFSGDIDITYLLRWFDWYPCSIEVKGGQLPLCATRFWVTSNKSPRDWYRLDPKVSEEQMQALLRRVVVTYFPLPYIPPRALPATESIQLDEDEEINNLSSELINLFT